MSDRERQLDELIFNLWLDGDWFEFTWRLEPHLREAAADAVTRHHDRGPDHGLTANQPYEDRYLRWWRDAYRVNPHGVDTWRIVAGAVVTAREPAPRKRRQYGVVVERPERRWRVASRRSVRMVVLVAGIAWDDPACEVSIDDITGVEISPADPVITPLGATTVDALDIDKEH